MAQFNSHSIWKYCAVVAVILLLLHAIWFGLHLPSLPSSSSFTASSLQKFIINDYCSNESYIFDVYKEHIPSLKQLGISTECKNWNTTNTGENYRHLALYSDPIELNYFFNRINCLTPTVFARYGDGEYMLMSSRKVSKVQLNEWIWNSSNLSKVGIELKEMALQSKQNGYLIGIPCVIQIGIPSAAEILQKLLKTITADTDHLTYNVLLRNTNRIRFKSYMIHFLIPNFRRFQIILFINNEIAKLNQKYFDCNLFWTTNVYYVEDDMINKYENNNRVYDQQWEKVAQIYTEKAIFLFSVGPIAEAMLHKMWQVNPNNLYLDIGSSLDEFVRGHVTRNYYDDVECSHNGRYGRVDDEWKCMFNCDPGKHLEKRPFWLGVP